ncbi:universal stress protein [Geomonas sp. RF6]|uniref:universal stress protein n=1 Tax=Geomonas sp. RF6 TaxID=2897342 RepID=UPI001E2EA2C8|nr:universal stress protein [Geomonas sp. RF6]UFS69628.1 universal stress protein [Geomonas sp. RF6]
MICLRKKILVAMDGSPLSDKAGEEAIRMAAGTPSRFKSKVFALLVIPEEDSESPADLEPADPEAETDEWHDPKERIFNVILKQASDEGVDLETAVAHGDPAEEILRLAQQEEIDVIIIGSTGKGFLKRKVIGSVSHKVVKGAKCSVYLVR